MEYSSKFQESVKKQVKAQASIERAIDKEIESFCDAYFQWIESQHKERRKPITIIAEGDSWFRYIVGKGVIFYLEKLFKVEILNLAYPGDEVRDMLSIKQKKRLIRLLKKGPIRNEKFDCLLFSGGGNDLVGIDRFHKWLHPYQPGMKPEDVLNEVTLNNALDILEAGYMEIINIRNTYSSETKIFFNVYDYAIPDGSGVCGKGPWLQPGLEYRRVPEELRREVVKLFLIRLYEKLSHIASQHKNVFVVETQGTLLDEYWANELHPTNSGFKQIAKKFESTIIESMK